MPSIDSAASALRNLLLPKGRRRSRLEVWFDSSPTLESHDVQARRFRGGALTRVRGYKRVGMPDQTT